MREKRKVRERVSEIERARQRDKIKINRQRETETKRDWSKNLDRQQNCFAEVIKQGTRR